MQKECRKMGDLCQKESCRKNKKKHCNEFSEEDGKKIFEQFWKAGNYGMQNTFIVTC